MKNEALKKSVLTAIFAALAVVIGFIQIPWPPAPHLAIDFSEVIILASFVTLGFKYAGVTVLLRSVTRLLIGLTTTVGSIIPYFGEVIAISASLTILLSYMLITHITKTEHKPLFGQREENPKKVPFVKHLINLSFVTVVFSILMVALNYFISVPIFVSGGKHIFFTTIIKDPQYAFLGTTLAAYTTGVVSVYLPFNLLKGILTMGVFELIHYRLKQMEI